MIILICSHFLSYDIFHAINNFVETKMNNFHLSDVNIFFTKFFCYFDVINVSLMLSPLAKHSVYFLFR